MIQPNFLCKEINILESQKSKDNFCCKCGSHLLPFETWREEDLDLVFCAYCKAKLMQFLTSKVKRHENLVFYYYPLTDAEIEQYVNEFVKGTEK